MFNHEFVVMVQKVLLLLLINDNEDRGEKLGVVFVTLKFIAEFVLLNLILFLVDLIGQVSLSE